MSLTRRFEGETGLTLIELLVTIVILATAVVVIAGGMATAALVSGQQREHATAETLLRRFAEDLQSENPTYVQCAGAGTYVAAPVGGFRPSVTAVRYWRAATNQFESTCPADEGAQLLTARVVSPNGRVTESVTVVKRRRD